MKYSDAAREVDFTHEQTAARRAFQLWRDSQPNKHCTCWLCGTSHMDYGWPAFLAGANMSTEAKLVDKQDGRVTKMIGNYTYDVLSDQRLPASIPSSKRT